MTNKTEKQVEFKIHPKIGDFEFDFFGTADNYEIHAYYEGKKSMKKSGIQLNMDTLKRV